MTTKEASELSGFSRRKVRKLITEGKIEAEKKNRQWNISKGSLEDFLEKEGKEEKDNKKEDGDEMKEAKKKKETVEAFDPITDLLNSEISRKKTLSALRALEELDSKRDSEKVETEKKDDLDLNTIIKFDLIKSLKTPPQPASEGGSKDDTMEKMMLWQMVQQNSQKPSKTGDRSSSELELLKRELVAQRENESLKQEIASLRQEIQELQKDKYSGLEEKLRSFQPSPEAKTKDWAGILTGAGSVLSSLLQALPMLRSEGISLTEIGDLVDRLTERKQQSNATDNFGGGNELMNNIVSLVSSLAKQKKGQQQVQQKQFAGTERQQGSESRQKQTDTANIVDQLALALTGAVNAADSPNSVIQAIHQMLPYISEQHIPIIKNLMNQLNPAWTDSVVEALEDELNVEFEEEAEDVVEEASRPTRQSRRFEGSTEHDLDLEE